MKQGGVIVAHPSRVLVAYQAALALQEAGLLRKKYLATLGQKKRDWIEQGLFKNPVTVEIKRYYDSLQKCERLALD